MPNIEPLINAAVKGARAVAGIAGKGGKNVGQVYQDSGAHVKVKPGKQEAPIKSKPKLGDLPSRGAKPTKLERVNRARDLQWEKAEKNYDAANEMRYTGLVSSDKGLVAARGPGKKNARKSDAIRREANKSLPIKINSK